MNNTGFAIDTAMVCKAGSRAQTSYSVHAQVPDAIADRLYDRLPLLKSTPARVLDLGTGNGRHLHTLRKLFPAAEVVGADLCVAALQQVKKPAFWQRSSPLVCMDAGRGWPFVDDSFDLIVSNLMLPWILPAEDFARELNRVLSRGGAFFLSSAGPDTLIELRSAWQQIDTAEHINAFLDMHDVGDLLHRAGISDPVMDTERIKVTYPSVEKLLDELMHTGCGAVVSGRRSGLMGSDIRSKIVASYPRADTDGRGEIIATLEVVYAHGWKGQQQASCGAAGEFPINIDGLRKSLR